MKDTALLRAEFNDIKAQALKIVETAKHEDRPMTEDERNKVEQFSNRMKDIDAQNEAIKAVVTASIEDNSRRKVDLNRPLKANESLFSAMGFRKPQLSLGQFMRATVIGPRNDYERFALQQGSDNTGGFEVPADVASLFIDSFRGYSTYLTAGGQMLPMVDRWKATSVTDPTATFAAENASVNTATPFTSVDLDPARLSVIVKVSREQLEDSINIGSEIETTLASAMALAADAAIGFGSSHPAGIYGTSGILSVTSSTNGDELSDYSKLLDAVYELQSNSSNPNAVVMSPREAKVINGFADTTDQPLRRPDALVNLPFLVSASVPITQTQGGSTDASTILVGDFTRLLIAIRVGLRIEVLKETYAANHQYGFQASMRIDSSVIRPKSFCKVTGIVPNAS